MISTGGGGVGRDRFISSSTRFRERHVGDAAGNRHVEAHRAGLLGAAYGDYESIGMLTRDKRRGVFAHDRRHLRRRRALVGSSVAAFR